MDNVHYNFIVPALPGYSLDRLLNSELNDELSLYSQGEFIWGLQSYERLKSVGMAVSLSFELAPGSINLAHGNVLRALKGRSDCYCVSLQADYPRFPLAQYHIVQNRDQCARNASFVPHWPQPGQLSRDRSRAAVEKVAYQGNGNFTELDQQGLNAALNPYGITFEILEKHRWPCLQEIDVLVGIRSFGKKQYKRKPPTKLFDAWHAGIPFIGGWDSAYEQLGTPGEDYLRVSTFNGLVENILALKNDPVKYNNLVAAGDQKAVDYTSDRIAVIWSELLEGPILENYIQWKQTPARDLKYEARKAGFKVRSSMRKCLHFCYKIPPVKFLRDRYYDPVT